jgi:hypothetical protein
MTKNENYIICWDDKKVYDSTDMFIHHLYNKKSTPTKVKSGLNRLFSKE